MMHVTLGQGHVRENGRDSGAKKDRWKKGRHYERSQAIYAISRVSFHRNTGNPLADGQTLNWKKVQLKLRKTIGSMPHGHRSQINETLETPLRSTTPDLSSLDFFPLQHCVPHPLVLFSVVNATPLFLVDAPPNISAIVSEHALIHLNDLFPIEMAPHQ